LVDHVALLERDEFDDFADHLLLRDASTNAVVAVYRLMRREHAARAGQFYSEREYDLGPLIATGKPLLELGRSCVHPDHRGGQALFGLWTALARYVEAHGIEMMFGVASLAGTDIADTAPALSVLYHDHLAPADLRVRARKYQEMNLLEPGSYDRRAAMISMPPLIKAYLRLGGAVGDGAFVDHTFNCTDVCMIMDTSRMNTRVARHYVEQAGK
jgi:putative hemolysin